MKNNYEGVTEKGVVLHYLSPLEIAVDQGESSNIAIRYTFTMCAHNIVLCACALCDDGGCFV